MSVRELLAAGLPNEKIFNLVSLSDPDRGHFASASSVPSLLCQHNNTGVCNDYVGVSHLETSQNDISHTLPAVSTVAFRDLQ